MSSLNPYDRFLDDAPLESILAKSPVVVASLLSRIGSERATTPIAPGKWSPAEILAHLADCELVLGYRLRQTLAEDGHRIQPFDQDKWAENYTETTAEEALALYASLRRWNLSLIRKTLPAAAGRVVTHPERGTMTFLTLGRIDI